MPFLVALNIAGKGLLQVTSHKRGERWPVWMRDDVALKTIKTIGTRGFRTSNSLKRFCGDQLQR